MIVARDHVENGSGLTEERWLALTRLWHGAEKVVLELTGAERAVAMKLGIQTPHLHIHLYPVSSSATRDDVFAWIDARRRDSEDRSFVAELRERLARALR
jgi:diadenosine tetraphosphate (Ap4A) HIT family hydrolase